MNLTREQALYVMGGTNTEKKDFSKIECDL